MFLSNFDNDFSSDKSNDACSYDGNSNDSVDESNYVKNPIYVVTMRGYAHLAAANVPNKCKNILMPYVVEYTYMMRRLEVIKTNGQNVTHYEHLCGELP